MCFVGQLQSFELFSAMAVFLRASHSDLPCVWVTTAESVEVTAVLAPTVVVTSTKQNGKQAKYLRKFDYNSLLWFIIYAGLFNFPIPLLRQSESREETNTIQLPNSSLIAEYFTLFSSIKDFSFLCDLS